MSTSAIKPIHARWLISVLNQLAERKDLIMSAWVKAGIFEHVHPVDSLEQVKLEAD